MNNPFSEYHKDTRIQGTLWALHMVHHQLHALATDLSKPRFDEFADMCEELCNGLHYYMDAEYDDE